MEDAMSIRTTLILTLAVWVLLVPSRFNAFAPIPALAAQPEQGECRAGARQLSSARRHLAVRKRELRNKRAKESTARDEWQSRKCYVGKRGRTMACKILARKIRIYKGSRKTAKKLVKINKRRVKKLKRFAAACGSARQANRRHYRVDSENAAAVINTMIGIGIAIGTKPRSREPRRGRGRGRRSRCHHQPRTSARHCGGR